MLEIVLNDESEIRWHVGESIPRIWQPENDKLPRRYVDLISASGDELIHIRSTFRGLPDVPGSSIVTWYGDHAKFIYTNLQPSIKRY